MARPSSKVAAADFELGAQQAVLLSSMLADVVLTVDRARQALDSGHLSAAVVLNVAHAMRRRAAFLADYVQSLPVVSAGHPPPFVSGGDK